MLHRKKVARRGPGVTHPEPRDNILLPASLPQTPSPINSVTAAAWESYKSCIFSVVHEPQDPRAPGQAHVQPWNWAAHLVLDHEGRPLPECERLRQVDGDGTLAGLVLDEETLCAAVGGSWHSTGAGKKRRGRVYLAPGGGSGAWAEP